MKTILIIISIFSCTVLARELPISEGNYKFQHRFAEHPNMESIILDVRIKGKEIILNNNDNSSVFPIGEIEKGELFWHESSKKWVVVRTEDEKEAKEVGGCSGGPSIIDLTNHIYWTC